VSFPSGGVSFLYQQVSYFMIDCVNTKYVIFFMLQRFHISKKLRKFKKCKEGMPQKKNRRAKRRMNGPREK